MNKQYFDTVIIGKGNEVEANSLRYFADTTFNYPTIADAYRVAGLDRIE